MLRVGDSTFLTTPVRDGSCYWIYLSEAATPCRRRQPPAGRAPGEPMSAHDLLEAAKEMGGVTARVTLRPETLRRRAK